MKNNNILTRAKKLILLLLLICTNLISQLNAQCPVGVDIEMLDLRGVPGFAQTDEIVVCGTPDTLALLMYINDPGGFNGIQLEVSLMPGMEYGDFVGTHFGSGPTIIATNTSNPQKPIFTINNIGQDSLAVFYIGVKGNCDTNPKFFDMLVDYKVTFNYTDEAGGLFNCESNYQPEAEFNSAFKVPVLNTLSVTPSTLIIAVPNSSQCQTILISQDGIKSYLDEFIFTVDSIDMTSFSSVDIQANGIAVTYTYDATNMQMSGLIDGTHFPGNTILNPANGIVDNLMQTDEQVSVQVCYQVSGCPDVNQFFIDYSSSWGCMDKMCEKPSTKDAAIVYAPDFGANPNAVNSLLEQPGMFCGQNLIWSTEISSTNTDPLEGLWQDVIMKWDACNTGNYNTAIVRIGGTSIPFTTVGGSVVVDLTANTSAIPGFSDEDSDGFIDDLAGGQTIMLEVEIDVICADPTIAESICEGNGCSIEKIDLSFKRNCNQAAQDFVTLSPAIEFGYGEISFSTNETVPLTGNASFLVTENAVSGDCSTYLPFVNGYELTYEYGTNNIQGCTAGNIYAEIFIEGPVSIWADIQYEAGSATYQTAAVAATTWAYETITNLSGEEDTLGIKIIIPAGNTATTTHDYYFNIEAKGSCEPPVNLSTSWKVYEECTDASCDQTPCLAIRSCHTVSTHLTFNETGCSCTCVWGSIAEIERCNFGWTDKEMTQKLTKADIPAADLKRFIPGDTALLTTKFVLYDGWVKAARKADYHWYFDLDFDDKWSTDVIYDVSGASMVSWHLAKDDGSTKDFEVPNDITAYYENLKANGISPANECPAIVFNNLGPVDYGPGLDPEKRACWLAGNDPTNTLANFPFAQSGEDGYNALNGEPHWAGEGRRSEAGVYYKQYSYTDFTDRTMRAVINWNNPFTCNNSDYTLNTDAPSNYVDQMNIKDGDTIVFQIKVPVMSNPNADKGMTFKNSDQRYAVGSLLSMDENTCNARVYNQTCPILNEVYESHKPGPVSSITTVNVTDCDIAVEHTFTLENPVPDIPNPLPANWTPWFENEYRPAIGVEYIEPFFPNNMIYLNDMIVEDYNGNIVPIPSEYVVDSLGNLNCIDDPTYGICCAANDPNSNASLRVIDQAYLDALALWPCNQSFATNIPVINRNLDPFPLLQVGGYEALSDPINCNMKVRYNLSALCPAEVNSSNFGVKAQFANVYLPDHLSRVNLSDNVCQPQTVYPNLSPELVDCDYQAVTLPDGTLWNQDIYWPYGNHPEDDTDHPDRTLIDETTTPDNFTDTSLDYPPLSCSNTPVLLAENTAGNEMVVYEVCAGSLAGGATHTNVATSITVPNSVALMAITEVGVGGLTFVQTSSTPTSTTYVVTGISDIPPNSCVQLNIETELLFCPIGLDVDTKVCVETVSGCIAPIKAASLLAESGACNATTCCYQYITEEADIQVEWIIEPVRAQTELCDVIEFGTLIKNVKPAVLVDLHAAWYFPYEGFEFIPGSWQVSYPGGPTTMAAWVDIPDPTIMTALSTAAGEYYEYTDDAIWSSFINTNGLEGISVDNATADENKVAFKFQATTYCDEFTSGTPIRFAAKGADPCGGDVISGIVESQPVVLQGADPEDYAQFLVVIEEDEYFCGANPNTMTFSALNLSEVTSSPDMQVCLTLPTGATYVAGSFSPVGFTTSETVTALGGGNTQICFEGPVGITAEVGSFSWSLDVNFEQDLACGDSEIGVDIKTQIDMVNCTSTNTPCTVFVINSINPLVPFKMGPPLESMDIELFSNCDTDPINQTLHYEVGLSNPGPNYNANVTINIHRDLNENGILEEFDPVIGTQTQSLSLANAMQTTLSGDITVDEDLACPVLLQIVYDGSCECLTEEFYITDVKPAAFIGLPELITVCPGDPINIGYCSDYTYSTSPDDQGTMSIIGDSISYLFNAGEVGPVVLSLVSNTGTCVDTTSIAFFNTGDYVMDLADIDVCPAGCTSINLDIAPEILANATISWNPTAFIDDPTSASVQICEPTSSTTYQVTATLPNGCSYTDSFEATLVSTVSLPATIANNDCFFADNPPLITAEAGYDIYEIYTVNGGVETYVGATSSNIITVDQGTDYIIKANNLMNPCGAQSTLISVTSNACYDYGDLPDISTTTSSSNYQTSSANNGPAHLIIEGLSLGTIVDTEPDGQQSLTATGDGNDEDGTALNANINWQPGAIINLPLSVTNTTGTQAELEIWIDWNGDGDFDDPNEFITNLSDDGAGDFGVNGRIIVTVPNDVATDQDLGFRARLSNQDDMTPYGAVASGEVEDYLISVSCEVKACYPVTLERRRGRQ